MKTLSVCTPFIGVLLATACFSGPGTPVDLGPAPAYQERNTITEIIDHDDNMPEWAGRYIDAGLAGIEALPEYGDRYVFIGRQAGNSLEPLLLWAAGFSVERDFPQLVSARIQERFIAGGDGNPGEKYGRYFEAVVKSASDTAFAGASREGGCWIKKRIFADDGISPAGEIYEYLIMTSIDRETLQRQINMLLITTRPDKTPFREQSAASMRLRLTFYEGF
jgi:hypothetical protein